MDALAVLVRLAEQALDRERLALSELDAEIAAVAATIQRQTATAEAERRLAADLPGAHACLAAYLAEHRRRLDALDGHLAQRRSARAAQWQRVVAGRVERERLVRLLERRTDRARTEAARRERLQLDELAILRSARARGGS